MAQPPHFDIEGSIYFITTRLKDRGRSFTEYETGIIKKTILDLAFRKELLLYAYVVMPDHLHILIKPTPYWDLKDHAVVKGKSFETDK